jgi:hypothetical protein
MEPDDLLHESVMAHEFGGRARMGNVCVGINNGTCTTALTLCCGRYWCDVHLEEHKSAQHKTYATMPSVAQGPCSLCGATDPHTCVIPRGNQGVAAAPPAAGLTHEELAQLLFHTDQRTQIEFQRGYGGRDPQRWDSWKDSPNWRTYTAMADALLARLGPAPGAAPAAGYSAAPEGPGPPPGPTCASCGKRPSVDPDVALERVNVKGIPGVWLCQWCDPARSVPPPEAAP